ncbi:amidohydrolase family protein [Dactylosporangium sp. NPDC049525]|uniref:amidohydrolase family protein n=1 Tax=Dactylosporangium sp. NPDC049525 TaxID=3154730 RepID=UPI00343197BC
MTDILDFHARLGPHPQAAARMLATMDNCGITRAVVVAGGMIDLERLSRHVVEGGHIEADADNQAVLDACEGSDGRLVPFWFGNPHRTAGRYRDAAGFRGLELSPAVHGVPLTDVRNTAFVEVAAEHRHPVYIVCLGRPGAGVADLVTLAGKFPEVTFVLGHCGFVGIDVNAVSRVVDTPNIVAETSGCYTGVAGAAVERLGAGRVLFGTEYPLQHPRVELAKFDALGLGPADWQRIAWDNGHRLLDPSEERA